MFAFLSSSLIFKFLKERPENILFNNAFYLPLSIPQKLTMLVTVEQDYHTKKVFQFIPDNFLLRRIYNHVVDCSIPKYENTFCTLIFIFVLEFIE